MSTKATSRVAGEMTVHWTVELPEDNRYNGQACEDPAVEAAMEAIGQHVQIYLWGEDEDPARVHLEVSEDEVTVEEDDR